MKDHAIPSHPRSTLQIGMTASSSYMSGTDRYFLSLTRMLVEKGVSVRGVVLGNPADVGAVPGIESFAPVGASRVERWRGLRRTVRHQIGGSDLVASHNAAHAFPVLDIVRSRPLVAHFHGPWSIEARNAGRDALTVRVRRIQELATYRRAKRIIAVSHAFRKILETEYRVDPNKIRVVPVGVDMSRFRADISRADARRALRWPTDRPLVMTAARLVPVKGIGTLIEAVGRLRASLPDVLLQIVGTGPLEEELKQQARDQGLERWVNFAGYLDDQMPLAYRAADVSIVSSIGLEGFPLTVPESLACGTPTLVTPHGGLPETVGDLDRSLVLPGSSPNEVAEGLRAVLTGRTPLPDDATCTAFARRYEWTAIADTILGIYAEATVA